MTVVKLRQHKRSYGLTWVYWLPEEREAYERKKRELMERGEPFEEEIENANV
jgi:hypothetical protein